ncbi:MAG: MerC domain-containing protein, partial [Acidobacteriota bacterium]
MQTLHEKGVLDYTGAAVSWACAIHCLAMPFLITALPLFGLGFLTDETTEMIFILVSVII